MPQLCEKFHLEYGILEPIIIVHDNKVEDSKNIKQGVNDHMTIKFIQYPRCTTCKKAQKWLDANEIQYENIHIVEQTPSKEELKQYWEKSGLPLKKFFNTSGQRYRNLGLKDKLSTMSEDEQLELLASDGMLIKRPIVTDGEKVTVGFKEAEFDEMWK